MVEKNLDELKLSKHHLKAMFVSGMGFFTDAYDLFIIGVALSLIAPVWGLTSSEIAILGSSSLLAALFGSVFFGRFADNFGRKKIYGLEALIMTIGALMSAFSPNFLFLLISRFILGIGIGGDYPVSAVIMSEYSNRTDRGKLVGLVFSMQALGLIIGPLVALSLLMLHIQLDIAWRVMLGLGALPSLFVIYLRRKLPESPRYLSQIMGDKKAALSAFGSFTGNNSESYKTVSNNKKISHGIKEFFSNKQHVLTLFGTAGSWFLLDWAYYGNTISTPIVMNAITDNSSLELKMLYSLLIFVVFALPGYILSIVFMDIIGRKYIQLMGFGVMAFSFLLLGIIPDIENNVVGFLILYGLSYLFTEFGPNTTTFVLPSELFPTEYRTTGHGFSAGIGKFGAFLGVLFFPIAESFLGLNMTFVIVSIICFLGILTTSVLTEPKGKSLEDCSYSKIIGK